MAFSLPSDLPTNWADSVGMIENAAFLNNVGAMNNKLKAAVNTIVNGTATATVATGETTTSTSYVDLTTTTDTVTVTIGSSGLALVVLYVNITTGAATSPGWMSYAISGGTTSAASDAKALSYDSQYGAGTSAMGTAILETGLASGSTTFKAKYKISAGSSACTFANRRIAVITFP